MLIEEHYLNLKNYYMNQMIGETFNVKLDEISDALACTRRNANFLLSRMVEKQWIEWTPGKGRGHSSQLVFLQAPESLILEIAKRKVLQNNLKGAHEFLDSITCENSVLSSFSSWLHAQMGFQVEDYKLHSIERLRFPFYRPILNLDPAFSTRRTESHIVTQIFDTLVCYNSKTHSIESHLCHHWFTNEEQTVWTFHLRKGLFFHDGKPLTSLDVKYTIERIQNPRTNSPHRWMTEDICKVTTPHERIIQINLVKPNSIFDHYLSRTTFSIVPKHIPNFSPEMPLGSGPFFVKQNDSSRLVLAANESYFKERATLDVIEIWVIPNYNGIETMSFEQLMPLSTSGLEENSSFSEIKNVEIGANYIVFNMNKSGPQHSKDFRTALQYVLNRRQMIAELGGLRETPAFSFIPGQGIATMACDHQLKLAQEYLVRSGYKGEKLLLFTYEMKINEDNAKWIRKRASEIGINIEVVVHSAPDLGKMEVMLQADLITAGEVFDLPVDLGLIDMFQRGNSFVGGCLDSRLKDIKQSFIEKTLSMSDSEDRLNTLLELEAVLLAERVLLPLFHSRQSVYHHDSLKGVTLNQLGWMNYRDLWIDYGVGED
ncbi:ABC transporter substrate-binding protein [Bacillus sp. 31A1R]|uniref:ABC transporter substrate-binding protein n=1 Tax=Robertmurraya mangrovi TaxID=3098077 RepID=A0ABU5IW24_9BACI|nr:ABC transporter substrate-binding protein [Bacillus sp. 31A1R]MDZ5471358.1 ABC transporter substrate-binding protein [Bacillus sp. 31A1R]